jgi:hypothetical protein
MSVLLATNDSPHMRNQLTKNTGDRMGSKSNDSQGVQWIGFAFLAGVIVASLAAWLY